jgi:SAM-dependent methyltransferase
MSSGAALALLSQLSEEPTRIADIETSPLTMAYFARMLLSQGRAERAAELAIRAMSLKPGDAELREVASQVLSFDLPKWHFSIVRDAARNAVYNEALRRHVRGKRVLEIGAGSGILAMMAARAGAKEVISCECNPAMAVIARDIVARNGFSDRVNIIAKHSRDLSLGDDLAGPADVLVSEIVSNDLLGQDILGCMEDAIGRLTAPAARVIPSHGSIRIALAYYSKAGDRSLEMVDGFDLSPLGRIAYHPLLAVGDESLELRGPAEDIFTFNFVAGGPFDVTRASARLKSNGGRANGFIQWMKVVMDHEASYESRPSQGNTSCWAVIFHPFTDSIDLASGEEIVIHGQRNRNSIWMWADTI